MDAIDALMTRRSIRKFKDIPVEWDKIGLILESGLNAPSAGNIQNWKFIVVLDEERRKQISEACLEQFWMQNAPVHIIIVSETEKARRFYGVRGERLYTIQNCAAAAQNMLIAAHAQGLGACWVGSFDEEQLRRCCGIPEYIRPQAVIAVGYADEVAPMPTKYRLYDITHIEKWDSHIKDLKWVMKEHAWSVEDRIKKDKKRIEKKLSPVRKKFSETTQTIMNRIKGRKNPRK